MRHLSGLDATFLHIESPEMPMHVGALHVFELPAGYKGRFANDLRALLAQRLPLMPALRRRLWWMPLNLTNPAWVDAEPNLDYHVIELKLPPSAKKGDGLAELHATVGRLHPRLLDRSKPLWRFHVLEGLANASGGRKRVGVYSQVHHAAVDGQAAVALANILFDLTPEPRAIETRPSTRTKVFRHNMAEMLRGAIANEVLQVGQILRDLPSTVGGLTRAAGAAAANTKLIGRGKSDNKVSNLALAPRTLLNVSVGPGRAFTSLSLPLAELRALAKAHEATLNDAVLMLCAGGLRRYFAARGLAIPRKPMIGAVPISLRAAGDTSSDNQASLTFISLGTHLADPAKRLAHIKGATAAMKATMGSLKSVIPTDFPSIGMPWLMEAARSAYGKAKVAEKVPPVATLAISNVPGPQVPLYLAGARMLTNYPTSIIVHGLALNVTVQSYDQHMDFGMMADAVAMPDVALFGQSVHAAFEELRALPVATGEGAAAKPAAPVKAAKSSKVAPAPKVSAKKAAAKKAVAKKAPAKKAASISKALGTPKPVAKPSASKAAKRSTASRKAAAPTAAPTTGKPVSSPRKTASKTTRKAVG